MATYDSDEIRAKNHGTIFRASGRSTKRLRLNRNTHKDHLKNEVITWHLVVEDKDYPDSTYMGVSLTTEQMQNMIEAWHQMLAETIELMEEGN
jgi:hypothetical protein